MDKYSVPSFTTTAREVLTDVYIAKEVEAEIAELKANSASNDIQIKAHWSLLKDKEDEIAELKALLLEGLEEATTEEDVPNYTAKVLKALEKSDET